MGVREEIIKERFQSWKELNGVEKIRHCARSILFEVPLGENQRQFTYDILDVISDKIEKGEINDI